MVELRPRGSFVALRIGFKSGGVALRIRVELEIHVTASTKRGHVRGAKQSPRGQIASVVTSLAMTVRKIIRNFLFR